LVIRGSVYPTQTLSLCRKAKDMFERAIDIQSLSLPDLYGGKICAALDRQHPRDLFDIKLLLENEGLSNEIRKAFVVYLISHNRPMVEILDPGLQNLTEIFNLEFEGMTIETVTLDELVSVRSELIKVIKQSLTIDERKFILSVKNKSPQWELIGIDHVKDLPAVKWKLKNINQMDIKKHREAVKKLRDYLEV